MIRSLAIINVYNFKALLHYKRIFNICTNQKKIRVKNTWVIKEWYVITILFPASWNQSNKNRIFSPEESLQLLQASIAKTLTNSQWGQDWRNCFSFVARVLDFSRAIRRPWKGKDIIEKIREILLTLLTGKVKIM